MKNTALHVFWKENFYSWYAIVSAPWVWAFVWRVCFVKEQPYRFMCGVAVLKVSILIWERCDLFNGSNTRCSILTSHSYRKQNLTTLKPFNDSRPITFQSLIPTKSFSLIIRDSKHPVWDYIQKNIQKSYKETQTLRMKTTDPVCHFSGPVKTSETNLSQPVDTELTALHKFWICTGNASPAGDTGTCTTLG